MSSFCIFQVTARFRLKPGTYLIVPSTYEPGVYLIFWWEKWWKWARLLLVVKMNRFANNAASTKPGFEGQFLLRTFTEKPNESHQLWLSLKDKKDKFCQNKLSSIFFASQVAHLMLWSWWWARRQAKRWTRGWQLMQCKKLSGSLSGSFPGSFSFSGSPPLSGTGGRGQWTWTIRVTGSWRWSGWQGGRQRVEGDDGGEIEDNCGGGQGGGQGGGEVDVMWWKKLSERSQLFDRSKRCKNRS